MSTADRISPKGESKACRGSIMLLQKRPNSYITVGSNPTSTQGHTLPLARLLVTLELAMEIEYPSHKEEDADEYEPNENDDLDGNE